MTTRSNDFFNDLRKPDATPVPTLRGRPFLTDEQKAERAEKNRKRAAAAKLREQAAARERAGFGEVKPIVAKDVRFLTNGGKAGFLTMRREFEETPTLKQGALDHVIKAVEGENRRSFETALTDLRVDTEGKLTRGEGGAHMDEHSVRQLANRLFMHRAGPYLVTCPGIVRAGNFNYWTDQLRKQENSESPSHLFKKSPRDHERRHVQVRVRNGGDSPQSTFAILGTGYRHDKDADKLASTLADLYPDARGTGVYDPSTTRSRFELLWMAPPEAVHSMCTGETFKVGARVTSSDRGDRSILVRAFLAEVRCTNLTVSTHVVDCATVRHTAKATARAVLQASVDESLGKLRPFIEAWRAADVTALVKGELHNVDVEPVFASLVKRGFVSAPGVDDETMVRRLRKAYWEFPKASVKGVIDAVTRMAHTNSWASPWTTDDLQEKAGQLLMTHEVVAEDSMEALANAKLKGWVPGRFSLETARGIRELEEAPVYVL